MDLKSRLKGIVKKSPRNRWDDIWGRGIKGGRKGREGAAVRGSADAEPRGHK